MQDLGNMTATLADSFRNAAQSGVRPHQSGAMAATAAFGANPGRLEMLSHVPGDLTRRSPLVVVLHGCGQSATDYASGAGWLALAETRRFAVLAPQQTSQNNPNRCFNWFAPADMVRGRGEAASIAAMVRHMIHAHDLDPSRVFVTGLSAGGAMTLVMLAAYPDLFAGGAVIAGLPYGVAEGPMQAMGAMHQADRRSGEDLSALVPNKAGRGLPRLTIWHGGADYVVAPANADAIARQWAVAQGLSEQPDDVTSSGRRTRSVWFRPRSRSAPAVELNVIDGLGHGAPLATQGPAGVGKAGPFMLEAGVSSSAEIADFWGIASSAAAKISAAAPSDIEPQDEQGAAANDSGWRLPFPGGVADQVLASVVGRVSQPVQDVIARALKTAGLMR